jgi:hypothetical protein
METIEIVTLVDITRTRVIRLAQGTPLELDQQRNFTTLQQCLEMRSVIEFDDSPTVDTVDIKSFGFGSNYKGKHRIWTFAFHTDRSGVYSDNTGNPAGNLISDIHEVPVIQKLTETINMDKAIFDSESAQSKNIIIRFK